MTTSTVEPQITWSQDQMVEVLLNEPDDFLKVRETLTRIGVASRKEKKLYQSCHILHKQGRYFIVHFKELFALDGKHANLTSAIALAGFKKKEVKVYTEFGKLHVEGKKEESKDDATIVYQGLAQRSFDRVWTITDDTEVRSVSFADGLLTVELGKVVPEHHSRKDYL